MYCPRGGFSCMGNVYARSNRTVGRGKFCSRKNSRVWRSLFSTHMQRPIASAHGRRIDDTQMIIFIPSTCGTMHQNHRVVVWAFSVFVLGRAPVQPLFPMRKGMTRPNASGAFGDPSAASSTRHSHMARWTATNPIGSHIPGFSGVVL